MYPYKCCDPRIPGKGYRAPRSAPPQCGVWPIKGRPRPDTKTPNCP